MPLSPLVRSAVFVSDLERSIAFYRHVIGLSEQLSEGDLPQAEAAALIGVEHGAIIRYVILKVPGPRVGMIGLFEITGPRPPTVERLSHGAHVGEVCLVFYTSDMDAVLGRLEAGGHLILCAPVWLKVSASHPARREMICADPDGVKVNLIERDPAEAWES